ncbi:hypothetical protein Arub01_54140 [Actinomadura rubrobrunea]|uniref:CoA carboxyltransferase C-terminal domain-containing protein n=1 Tax=Actinomadura rubrobrunea TaxID=115335 RepID=A0A9W6UWZ2_9ACTN|nr:carboxyl transferase domain-containing protein [Actinomadura rubrobrunea]GLW67171.1 hypothetical protein Arub01_54140 [Actinomadura rubrobrunea]
MCTTFDASLVVVVDVPAYLPGARQEWDGLDWYGAELLYAFGEATVPSFTVITRKFCGDAKHDRVYREGRHGNIPLSPLRLRTRLPC